MRRIPLYFLTLLLFLPLHLLSQKQHNVWTFGNYAGLDFNAGIPVPIKDSIYTLEGNASISDFNGNLLFYSDGVKVWDRNHNIMPNGTHLRGGNSSTQSAHIVPFPGNSTKYFLFTTGDYTQVEGGLSYSIVDMTLNNGNGDIISNAKNIIVLDSTAEMVTDVLHTNGEDIWIITHKLNSIDFYSYLLTSSGLSTTPVISSIGSYLLYNSGLSYPGPIKASHNGKQIVMSATFGGICEMFDFNLSTGELSNFANLKQLVPELQVYGIEFSPNDSLLYLSGFALSNDSNFVAQIAFDPDTVVTVVASYHEVDQEFGALQVGPDNKIYLARRFKDFLGVFHKPDLKGNACEYEEIAVTLAPGTDCAYGLPQAAPYSYCPVPTLGNDITICEGDSLEISITTPLTVSCPYTFIWDDGSTDAVKIITHPGYYWIEITALDMTFRDSIFVDSILHAEVSHTLCPGESFEGYTEEGTYIDTLTSSSGCDSIRTLLLSVDTFSIFTTRVRICEGDDWDGYTESGIFIDTFPDESCGNIRILELTVFSCDPIISYDLDACKSIMANGTHMDYSEFTPEYPNILPCADVSAVNVYRNFQQKHSCTPGPDGSAAMCVSSLHDCEYNHGDSLSIIIEFTIDPKGDSLVKITGFEFYERAPLNYEWINGPGGTNNFPFYFGISIIKNGVEIFRRPIVHTNPEWTLQSFDFLNSNAFNVTTPSHFRIELLPYCTTLEDAEVSAWDIDNIRIFGGCAPDITPKGIIEGYILTRDDKPVSNVAVFLSDNETFTNKQTVLTDLNGYYKFDTIQTTKRYFIKAYHNKDVLNGVSAFDLLIIQKHLLGIESFTALDHFIAGDANRSSNVSAIDLLEIRKLLLGKINSFPNNTSWRFGVLPQDLTGSDMTKFEETKMIDFVDGSTLEVNFRAVKIGDLNGDAD